MTQIDIEEYIGKSKAQEIILSYYSTQPNLLVAFKGDLAYLSKGDYSMAVSIADWMKWKVEGLMIQDVMIHLDADQREFLLTGMTPDEWDAMFPEEGEIV